MTRFTCNIEGVMANPEYLLHDWKDSLSRVKDVEIVDFDNCSSNFNNHVYLILADGIEATCYRQEDSDCMFEIGTPVVSKGWN